MAVDLTLRGTRVMDFKRSVATPADRPGRPGGSGGGVRPGFALVGAGRLADAVAAALAICGNLDRVADGGFGDAGPETYALLVAATDTWDSSCYAGLRHACTDAGLPWLPVRAELGTAVVGPLERPGARGCVQCLDTRRRRTRFGSGAGRTIWDTIWERHGAALAQTPSAWLAGLGCDTVAAVVAGAATALSADPDRVTLLDQAAVFVNLEELVATRHRFLPEPLCGECGRLPDDAPEAAEVSLASRVKPTPDTYRVRPVADELEDLVGVYVDPEAGMIPELRVGSEGGLAVAVGVMPTRIPGRTQDGIGRTRSYRTSRLVALLEALERWGGMQPGGRRTVVCASFADLPGPALDPRTLGTHPAQNYQLPGFAFRPFAEDEVCHWVWGYSFARGAPILVPETVAYYGGVLYREGADRPFAYEVSNGCALGSCLEEAIFYGLLEVAERDASLLTWHARLPAPRIDLHTARNRAVPMQAAAITADTGYEVAAYDTTVEHGIPCVWAMATRPGGEEGQAAAACAGGSHPDPERAALGALSELGPQLADLARRFPDQADQARRLAANPDLVATIHDHQLLYGDREAARRLDFLAGSTEVRSLADVGARGVFGHVDLRADLEGALHRYLEVGMDVVVVDQTTPEHRSGGFACAKVLVPGTVPITFGHRHRRLDGLPRLYEVPYKLGYLSRPLTHGELNPHPHPFL
jgi:ribosomal protein S12 methylthiotransferase accessory factor